MHQKLAYGIGREWPNFIPAPGLLPRRSLHLGERIRPRGAFGPCVVTSRRDYFVTGGHAHPLVRGAILEDSYLGRVYREAGLPVRCLGGKGTVSFRMYPGGLRQVVEGWTRNLGGGSLGAHVSTSLLVALWTAGCLGASAAPAWALFQPDLFSDAAPALLATITYGAYAAQVRWMLRRIGCFGWWPALLFPIPVTFGIAVGVRAVAVMLAKRSVRWKGRDLSTRLFRERPTEQVGDGRANREYRPNLAG